MALSIEQQRKYARMLTPEQLANYVKNPDMGNEIGVTPSVFAEAIAEINAEDKKPQPAASNTVIDREVNEMLGGRSQGVGGVVAPHFSHGGIITGYQNGGDVNPDKPLSTRELYEQRQKELGQAQGYSELDRLSTPGGTGVPAGWQAYVDLMQSGKVEEGLQRAWEGSGPVTESPSLLERMNLGEKYFGLQSSSPVDQGIITLEEMAKEQSATGDFGGVEGARLRELQDIPLTQKQQNLFGILQGQQGSSKSERDDDIRQGKEVAKKVEEGILVDVPDSNFADHITRIENLIDEPLKPEQQDLLDKLESRTAITDRISELEGSREGDYEEYLQNRFFNALANIARPGGIGASLSASDSAYSREQDNLENILADLKMQGEGQDIDAARVAAEFSTLGDRYVPALLDAGLAGIQDEAASARHAADLNLRRYEIQKTLEARTPTSIEQQFQLLDVLHKAKENQDLMLSDPDLKDAIDEKIGILSWLLMGSVNTEAQDEE